jgi:TPR repeat protein
MAPLMARRLMVLLLLACVSGPARAGFEEGLAAFYSFDYATALHEWIPLAEAGDSRAQYQLALMYYRGEGLPQDYEKAAL